MSFDHGENSESRVQCSPVVPSLVATVFQRMHGVAVLPHIVAFTPSCEFIAHDIAIDGPGACVRAIAVWAEQPKA